jgi:dTDP-4-dehydrorhamnose 3,5-epimerase-like enzyme
MNYDKPTILDLPKIEDMRGNLSFIEEDSHIPFSIERVYWIYDVPGGQVRGGHAFKKQQELIVALSGSFNVVVDDGCQKQNFNLNRSYYGLYIPAGFWRQMENFSTNSLAIVMSSTNYHEHDYIRDYSKFMEFCNK